MKPVGKPGRTGELMPVEVALARLLALAEVAPIQGTETVLLAASEGRVLAHDLVSVLTCRHGPTVPWTAMR